MPSSRLRYILLGLFAVVIWAAIPAFVKLGSKVETLPFLLVLRFGIASLFFVHIFKNILNKARSLRARDWVLLLVSLGANFYFQGLAMIELPVSWYLIVFSLNPVFALLVVGVKFSKRLAFGLVIAVLGTILFINPEELHKTYGILPIMYLIIGMFTWVSYTVLAKRLQAVYSNQEVTAVTQFIALIACLVIWMGSGSVTFSPSQMEWASILALGIFTPLAYYSFTSCLRVMPKFSIVSQYLEPVFGVLIGISLFGEVLTLPQIAGSILIIAGSVAIEQ